ncbi:MAG: hypothetical protein JNK78_04105 [Planctomycetes bacterium]|nr:hypothetical protein [Planctomycetota bacterium]
MRLGAILLVVVAASCTDPGPTADSEIAAEVRALRETLRRSSPGEPRASAADEAARWSAVLQPMREAMHALASEQRELAEKQLALTQELQRWSQLLVESTSAARRDESDALTARLQRLETALKEQNARQRETEALLQKALDHTADRLEDFLKRIDGLPVAPPANHTAPGAPSTATDPAPKSVGAVGSPRRRAGTLAAWWWVGTAAAVAGLGVAWAARFRRQAGGESAAAASTFARPEVEAAPRDVQEIWAAAALLGEAVGRLRESHANPTELPASEREAAAQEVAGPAGPPGDGSEVEGDFVVLDDELLHPAVAGAAPPRRQPPEGTVCHIRTDDPTRAMQAALHVLADDPRVLHRPEPTVRCGRDSVEVTFRAVPGLPAGERVHLEQRLRDACA